MYLGYNVGSAEAPSPHAIKRDFKRLASGEFGAFLHYLKNDLQKSYDTLANTTDQTVVYRMQGRIKIVEEILGAVEKSTNNS